MHVFFCFSNGSFLVEAAEIRESAVSARTRSLDLHLEVLVNNARFVLPDFCLLGLVVHRVVVLIQVVQRRVLVRRGSRDFSGWRIPSVLGLAETVLALSLDRREYQCLTSDFGILVRSRSWQFLASRQSLLTFWKLSSHGIFLRLRKLLEYHELIVTKFLAADFLEVIAWSGQTLVSLLLYIINENFLHVITTNANAILLICLTALLSESISQIVRKRRWQFSLFFLVWVVTEPLRRVEERSSVSIVLLLPKKIIGVVGNLLVESSVPWEPLTFGEGEHGL